MTDGLPSMSILGSIMASVLGRHQAAPPPPTSPGAAPRDERHAPTVAPHETGARVAAASAPPVHTGQPAHAPTPTPPHAAAAAPQVDVAAVLDKLAKEAGQKLKLDWRTSIVDLMKLLKLDSGPAARKALAKELNYTGDTKDSAAMNVWLHKQVMARLAQNGGKLPDDLKPDLKPDRLH
jgi:uncharacterized protein DUF3597